MLVVLAVQAWSLAEPGSAGGASVEPGGSGMLGSASVEHGGAGMLGSGAGVSGGSVVLGSASNGGKLEALSAGI